MGLQGVIATSQGISNRIPVRGASGLAASRLISARMRVAAACRSCRGVQMSTPADNRRARLLGVGCRCGTGSLGGALVGPRASGLPDRSWLASTGEPVQTPSDRTGRRPGLISGRGRDCSRVACRFACRGAWHRRVDLAATCVFGIGESRACAGLLSVARIVVRAISGDLPLCPTWTGPLILALGLAYMNGGGRARTADLGVMNPTL